MQPPTIEFRVTCVPITGHESRYLEHRRENPMVFPGLRYLAQMKWRNVQRMKRVFGCTKDIRCNWERDVWGKLRAVGYSMPNEFQADYMRDVMASDPRLRGLFRVNGRKKR